MAYNEAKAAMARKGYKLNDVAPKMDMGISLLSQKLNGKSPMTLVEAKTFKKIVGSDLPLEELFKEFEEAE